MTKRNEIAEARVWAEWRMGGMLKDMPKHPAGRPAKNQLQTATDLPPTLAGLGIEKTAATFRRASGLWRWRLPLYPLIQTTVHESRYG